MKSIQWLTENKQCLTQVELVKQHEVQEYALSETAMKALTDNFLPRPYGPEGCKGAKVYWSALFLRRSGYYNLFASCLDAYIKPSLIVYEVWNLDRSEVFQEVYLCTWI